MGLHRHKTVRMCMLSVFSECQNWKIYQWKKGIWPDKSHFLLNNVSGSVCVHYYPGKEMAPGSRMHCGDTSWWRQCEGLGNVLGNIGSHHLCGRYFITYHLPQHHWRPSTHLHSNSILWVTPASFSRTMHPDTLYKLYVNNFRNMKKNFAVLFWPPQILLSFYEVFWPVILLCRTSTKMWSLKGLLIAASCYVNI